MRINAGFFANHAEIVDEMLNVSGGCWNSTTVPPGSAGFRCRCVILCDVRRQDRGQTFSLHIDATGPTGREWIPARTVHFTVENPMVFMITQPIVLPIEPSGGRHVYTVRLADHDERIVLPLQIRIAPAPRG